MINRGVAAPQTMVTTIGHGDLAPHGAGARLFTVAYALTGIGLLGTLIGVLARHIVALQTEQRRRHGRSAPPATGEDP